MAAAMAEPHTAMAETAMAETIMEPADETERDEAVIGGAIDIGRIIIA
jgi:hypothetical protein